LEIDTGNCFRGVAACRGRAQSLGIVLAGVFRLGAWFVFSVPEGETIRLDLSMDWRVLLFTGLIAIFTCMGFGLVPAFRSSRGTLDWRSSPELAGLPPARSAFRFSDCWLCRS